MVRRLLPVPAVLIMCFAAIACFAQKESLVIGPGDMLHVQVFDTPEMEQHARVTDSGEVPLMFIGSLKVAGLTPTAASHAIEKALIDKQYMREPQVTVVVEQFATQNISVLGEVQQPGVFPTPTAISILKVLSLAGGLTATADRNITIERQGNATEKVNYFLSNTSNQALTDSVLVYPGDTVLVPKAGVIYMLGDVGRPGGYPMSTNNSEMTLMQAVTMAGSTTKTSVPSKMRLIRKTPTGTQQTIVSLSDIEKGTQSDIPLKADDIVYVPFSWMKNTALSAGTIAASAAGAAIYVGH
ncbi:MAG TPA: polysaccharide biosynthesis/export family protein [Bryobacteraceae bacterium]|jgi:polysaccharide export outer membrane protein|nr:polysaccharide biosynthesis/export family protein [Bryobacteraceae bacterium]